MFTLTFTKNSNPIPLLAYDRNSNLHDEKPPESLEALSVARVHSQRPEPAHSEQRP